MPLRSLSGFIARRRGLAMLAVLAAAICIAGASGARAETSARDVAALTRAKLIYIATVRKDGNQSTAVPVWFILDKDNRLLIQTGPQSWKAKRIRRGSPALVWIGNSAGPAFIGRAEITTDPAALAQIESDIPRKYLLARVGFSRPTQAKFDAGKICAIRIAPMRDLPDGFTSQPGTRAPALKAANSAAAPPPSSAKPH
ncbi:MAG TPA: pyridoxamine 5'-phosphate oxidase family protein [Candidatus Binataceae bacterium]|nr:pyridoxamine 5'-phosphate oxidase family protein [Candidatus Binataceae bacterium]